MTTKTSVIISAVAMLGAFAAGRWAAPEKIRIETKTVEVERKTEQTKTDTERDRRRETVVTEVERPDGTKERTTKTVEETQTTKKTDRTATDDIKTTQSTSEETTRGTSKVTISALAGIPTTAPGVPVYGLHVSKPILGPITVGFWGLSDTTVGCSLGLTF